MPGKTAKTHQRKVSPATLKDVARLACCSTATASTVLNHARGHTRLSEHTRQKVLEVARRLHYRPHFAARSLVSRFTRTLGIHVSSRPFRGLGNSAYEGRLLRGIERACRERQFSLLVINLAGEAPDEASARQLGEQRVDGLILIQTLAADARTVRLLGLVDRAVLIDHESPDGRAPSVVFDNHAAMDLAVGHLAELGHRRIGFLGTCVARNVPDSAQRRREGYLAAMDGHGLDVDGRWIHDWRTSGATMDAVDDFCRIEGAGGAEYIVANLAPEDRPTALIAYNDMVAGGACRRLAEHSVRVPGDISVIGVDDSDLCRFVTPTLSSVRQPLEDMGHHAAMTLIEQIVPETDREGPRARPGPMGGVLRFAPELVRRESTGPAPAARPARREER